MMHVLVDGQNELGECVLWCERSGRVFWTDIPGALLYAHNPATGATERWPMPECLCCFALTDDEDCLLAGFASGLAFFHLSSGAVRRITDVEADNPSTRLNDGRCDRQGRFVFGMFNQDEGPKAAVGGFYRLDQSLALERLDLPPAAIANSICFSPDGATMYFADSLTGAIQCCDYPAGSGALCHPRVFAPADAAPGEPDGSCIDAAGNLWSTRWGAAQVVCFRPDGGVNQVLALPAPQPSCPAFGGAQLDTLFVSSARLGMDAAQLEAAPSSGALLQLPGAGRGLPEVRFRIAPGAIEHGTTGSP